MLEIRLRILDVRERDSDPFTHLGIVEGAPRSQFTLPRSSRRNGIS